MGRHAEHASGLTVSVVLGEYEIERHVNELLAEPRPAAPGAADLSSLNQQLPAKWFALDEDFRLALGKLRDAVRARQDEQTLTQLEVVLRACRACHRALKPNPPRP